jgi:hypothetical protein
MTSTLFFSSAPPPPSESSLVIEDWTAEEAEPSKYQIEHRGRLKRIALAVIVVCAVGAALAVGVELSRRSIAETPSNNGR